MSNNIARIASLIGDPSRSLMLLALLSGRALTAGELSNHANVSASTTSGHLKLLVEEGLILYHQQGRHRYFYLANEELALLLEKLLNLANKEPALLASSAPHALRYARSCYKHLAGSLSVQLRDAMQAMGHLQCEGQLVQLSDSGVKCLSELGVLDTIYIDKPDALRNCMDWSERCFHLAGPIADALLAFFIDRRWLLHDQHIPRQLLLTEKGRKKLASVWKLSFSN